MELNDLEYPLPDQIKQLLTAVVDVAKDNQILTLFCTALPGNVSGSYSYTIDNPEGDDVTVENIKGYPIESLTMLGLIYPNPDNDQLLFVTPLAFERINYERKNKFMRWWARVWMQRSKAVLAVTATTIFILVVLQIAQIVGWIKTSP